MNSAGLSASSKPLRSMVPVQEIFCGQFSTVARKDVELLGYQGQPGTHQPNSLLDSIGCIINAVDSTTPRRHLLTLVGQLSLGPYKVVRSTERALALGILEDCWCPPQPLLKPLTFFGFNFFSLPRMRT